MIITPRGSPVDPDVYCSMASDADVMSGVRHPAASPYCNPSMSSHDSARNSGLWFSQSSMRAINALVTIATRAPQSATMLATRGSARRGLGG